MKPRILLIGKSGQVGRELNILLPSLGELTAPDRSQLDLSKPDQIRTTIRSLRPNLIVNAAAYTAVDQAESEPAVAKAINADAPGLLAQEAKGIDALLVHYSTDYVFDGTKARPYVEEDLPNPQSVYGKTKLAGERAVQDSGAKHLIFRTAWVYAQEGRNFVLTILRLAAEREELRIVRDQIGAPTWSREIAIATSRILEQISLSRPDDSRSFEKSGIYHMTAGGEISWYDFARAILEEASLSPTLRPWVAAATRYKRMVARSVIPIATSEYPTPARRPPYSVLSNARMENEFGLRLPDWRAQLHSLFLV